MFTLGAAGLVAAYVVLAVLLLSINLYSRWRWPVKAVATLLVTAFYVVTYQSIPPLLGWPASQELPERFNLVAAYVEEPDKATGDDGAIYLWVTNLDEGFENVRPRAYSVPFSSELHQEVAEASGKLRKGIPQLGETKDAKLGPNGRPLDTSQQGQASVSVEFFDLPDPLFPEK